MLQDFVRLRWSDLEGPEKYAIKQSILNLVADVNESTKQTTRICSEIGKYDKRFLTKML